MSRKLKQHFPGLIVELNRYAARRHLEFMAYSEFHMRIMDGGYTVVDVWTTGRYYILTTDYVEMVGPGLIERGGEKGFVPRTNINKWLDAIFFPEVKI